MALVTVEDLKQTQTDLVRRWAREAEFGSAYSYVASGAGVFGNAKDRLGLPAKLLERLRRRVAEPPRAISLGATAATASLEARNINPAPSA